MTGLLIVCGLLCACTIAVIVIVVREDLEEAPRFVPGGPVCAPYDFDFDDHTDQAIALLGDDFSLWEKEIAA